MAERDVSRLVSAASSLSVLSSHALRLALGFFVSLVLARSMAPSEYGVFSLLMGFLLTASAVSDFGINIPFVRFYVQQQADPSSSVDRFAGFAYGWRIAVSGVAMAVTFGMLYLWGEEFLQRPLSFWTIVLGSVLVFSEGISSFLLALLQARGRFQTLSALTVSPNALRIIVLGALVTLDLITFSTAFLVFSGTLIVTMCAARILTRDLRVRWDFWRAVDDYRPALSWTKWTMVQTLSNVFVSKFDILALGVYAIDPCRIGNYALALAFGSLLSVLQSSTITLLLPRVSGLLTRDGFEEYRRDMVRLSVLLGGAILIATLGGYQVITALYADRYPQAGDLFLLITGAFGVSTLVTPWTLLTYAVNRPQIPAVLNLTGIGVLVVASSLLVPRLEVTGMAVSVLLSRLVAECVGLALTIGAVRRSPLMSRDRRPA